MTIKEAVKYELNVSIDDGLVDKALIDGNITGGNTYTSGNKKDVDLVVLSLLEGLLSVADVSEGGYSIRYDRKSIEARILALKKVYFPDSVSTPVLKAVHVW